MLISVNVKIYYLLQPLCSFLSRPLLPGFVAALTMVVHRGEPAEISINPLLVTRRQQTHTGLALHYTHLLISRLLESLVLLGCLYSFLNLRNHLLQDLLLGPLGH